MDRGIINHNHSFLGDGIAKSIKASNHNVCVNAAFHTEEDQIVIGVEEPQDIETLAF